MPQAASLHIFCFLDCYMVRFRLASGVEGTLTQAGGAWGPLDAMVRVAGTRGSIWLDNSDIWLADKDGARKGGRVPAPAAAAGKLRPAPAA